jgi:hypothetical protein
MKSLQCQRLLRNLGINVNTVLTGIFLDEFWKVVLILLQTSKIGSLAAISDDNNLGRWLIHDPDIKKAKPEHAETHMPEKLCKKLKLAFAGKLTPEQI